ncbi:TlpA family protein disulfide reductase [Macrococcus equipercicus]|uniref:TlpA family protein disulfide reductase n=1 Tax=Macrococcus equipercicus TaxID=69967 RepID=A0ABQ6RBB2_9STAP|nr:TlpA disulfide reductase family protein [Macrococcus equipercicus]KAA1042458.1 TlpA family protein disulfide reductase [Macrococcus equipercicus]
MKRFMIILLSAALLAAAGYSVWRVLTYDDQSNQVAGHPHYLNGKNITEMTAYDQHGKPQPLTELLTGDINIINFWASWCEPCNREMPALVNYNHDKPGHVTVIGMNLQDKELNRTAFIKKYHADYPILTADASVRKNYKINNLPTTIFVNSKGVVLKTYLGELNEEKVKVLIQQIEEGE